MQHVCFIQDFSLASLQEIWLNKITKEWKNQQSVEYMKQQEVSVKLELSTYFCHFLVVCLGEHT
jgi:hypothetical protein